MPTTSNFGWTTPADTDLVKDGALAIRTLGNGIDTSFLDLKGGTTGQILSKASNTDLDFTWTAGGDITEVQAGVGISVASGTGPIPIITNSSTDLITTAGDLLYGTAADTVARLGIGTAGQVLKVNSGATAPEWGAAGASFVGCAAFATTTQTISNNTTTAVNLDAELFDTDGFHSNVTNNTRMTIPSGKAGKYLITGTISWATDGNEYRQLRFNVNGNLKQFIQVQPVTAATRGTSMSHSTILNLSVGDYVEMAANQGSGGNLNTQGDATDGYNTTMRIVYLGA